jgi:RNA polymerase sigma-70 factor, ECF subfamily
MHNVCAMSLKQQKRPRQCSNDSAPCLPRLRKLSSESKSPPVSEEREIVQRAIAGDSEALSTLFARESARLYRTAFAVLRNKQDSEDALQNGLCAVYLHPESFEGRSKVSTWLARIVPNAALMNLRKRRVLPQTSIDDVVRGNPQPCALGLLDPHPVPDPVYAIAEMNNVLKDRMNQLSPLLRSAFHLRQHFSTREAAHVASVKTSAMKSRTTRARRQLARLLAARACVHRGFGFKQWFWLFGKANHSNLFEKEKER